MAVLNELVGQVLTSIEEQTDEVIFNCADGKTFHLFHSQDCCESVQVERIEGDLSDLVGSVITRAEERTYDEPERVYDDSHTWALYSFATEKGVVDIYWLGQSNGYYSESVEFGLKGG